MSIKIEQRDTIKVILIKVTVTQFIFMLTCALTDLKNTSINRQIYQKMALVTVV